MHAVPLDKGQSRRVLIVGSTCRPLARCPRRCLSAQPALAQTTAYPTVTDAEFEHPDAGDWLMYRRTLRRVELQPAEADHLEQRQPPDAGLVDDADLLGAHETTAIVNHGRMFITTPQNNIIALDAKTGTSTLAVRPESTRTACSSSIRQTAQVALYGDNVTMATTRLCARGARRRDGQGTLDRPTR